MSSLPQQLNYNFIRPQGFPCKIRQEKFTPISFNTSSSGVSSSDVVRFNISNDGYWDPYSAYIKIEVDVSDMGGNKDPTTDNYSVGSQQLDNSASSFINQLIIYKEGTELERIEEYDTLAACLNDIHGSNDNRSTRYMEGMYAQQMPTATQYNNNLQIADLDGQIGNTLLTGFQPLSSINIGDYQPAKVQYQLTRLNTQHVVSYLQRYEYTLLYGEGKLSIQNPNNTTAFEHGRLVNTAETLIGNSNTLFNGYCQPFCPQLSSFGNEPLLSKNIPTFCTSKGKTGEFQYQDKMTFCVPIISGLIGVLMPQESYKFVPMKALQDLVLEFRLSPYALFTSGYADKTQLFTDSNAIVPMDTTVNPMLQRKWKITKFELNVEMSYFENDIDNIILSKLNTTQGIVLHTQSWLLGPRYTIPGGSNASGTYQVNLAFESLKNVMFCFIPDDYQKYSFCRKQYRLSQNITSMYMKLGNIYHPPLPITGHGGNSAGYSSLNNEVDQSNAEFLVQLYQTFGKFNDIQANTTINSINFAVNQRAYDPSNTQGLVVENGGEYKYSNIDTTLSLPLFHENRCVGRSVYGMNLETVSQESSILSGFRTIGVSPYEITLKSDQNNPYPRNVTMYVFNNFDMLIQLGKNGVQVHGKG